MLSCFGIEKGGQGVKALKCNRLHCPRHARSKRADRTAWWPLQLDWQHGGSERLQVAGWQQPLLWFQWPNSGDFSLVLAGCGQSPVAPMQPVLRFPRNLLGFFRNALLPLSLDCELPT